MIIGIDASRANRMQKTGVEWYSYHLIEELKKIIPRDITRVILYSDEALGGGLETLPYGWSSEIIKSPVKSPKTKKAWLWTQLRLSWEMLRKKPDVLFVPSHAMPLIHPKKTITTIHDIGFLRYPDAYNKYACLYHRFSTWFAARFAFRIIVPSEFTRKELMRVYKIPHWKITVTHLGYNQVAYNTNKVENESAVLFKYKIEKPYFLFVGRIEEKKNISGLIQAFNLFIKNTGSGHSLVLVGVEGFGFSKIKEEILDLGLHNRVNILGYVRGEDIPVLYKEASALILPSFYEGFGIPILEAMACGTPVIGSKAASIPEVAGDAAVLVCPKKPEELAQAMNVVLNDLTRRILIERGLQRVKNFSWERTARETWEVLSL
ncbi:MAG: glycosyltransferase family 4 protein [Parcubacteria group bacterium]|nr:glycosyltransferase family 4 protein [Parcubacteria group bacterium]